MPYYSVRPLDLKKYIGHAFFKYQICGVGGYHRNSKHVWNKLSEKQQAKLNLNTKVLGYYYKYYHGRVVK